MSKDKKITHIDKKRLDHLTVNGHYNSMLENFETLRIKLLYDKELTKQEAIMLITLTKYFIRNGHNEAFRLSCEYLYERYIGPYEL